MQLPLTAVEALTTACGIVNKQMLKFYWNLGKDIVEKQNDFKMGIESFFVNLSKDLTRDSQSIKDT